LARCLERGARVLSPQGHPFTDGDIGAALATRALLEEMRQGCAVTGGPAAMTATEIAGADEHVGRAGPVEQVPGDRSVGVAVAEQKQLHGPEPFSRALF
jgi:hypothetical protein